MRVDIHMLGNTCLMMYYVHTIVVDDVARRCPKEEGGERWPRGLPRPPPPPKAMPLQPREPDYPPSWKKWEQSWSGWDDGGWQGWSSQSWKMQAGRGAMETYNHVNQMTFHAMETCKGLQLRSGSRE